MAKLRELFPQHFAMAYLGLITGLARPRFAAQVRGVVTRSISGHLTEGMQRHDSTVSGEEQRQALAKAINLTRVRRPLIYGSVTARKPSPAGSSPRELANGEVGSRPWQVGSPREGRLIPGPNPAFFAVFSERETGFEPATSTLARLHSTTELLPQALPERMELARCTARVRSGRCRGEEPRPATGPSYPPGREVSRPRIENETIQ
jgi:hypothetical protein